MKNYLLKLGKNSKKTLRHNVNSIKKNKVLKDYTKLILSNQLRIISENQKDISNAKKNKLKENLINRLLLDKKNFTNYKFNKKIISLKDPVDQVIKKWKRPNGLRIEKTIPLGVIAVIYESRPNVTSDVASLCFKSGNPVILKGGSEAFYSNKILINLFKKLLKK